MGDELCVKVVILKIFMNSDSIFQESSVHQTCFHKNRQHFPRFSLHMVSLYNMVRIRQLKHRLVVWQRLW